MSISKVCVYKQTTDEGFGISLRAIYSHYFQTQIQKAVHREDSHLYLDTSNLNVSFATDLSVCFLIDKMGTATYLSAQAAITKTIELGGLNNRNLFSHSSRGWKFKIRLPEWLGFSKSSLPGF